MKQQFIISEFNTNSFRLLNIDGTVIPLLHTGKGQFIYTASPNPRFNLIYKYGPAWNQHRSFLFEKAFFSYQLGY